MNVGFMLAFTALLLSIWMLLKVIGYIKDIQVKAKENPKEIRSYGREIAIGIAGGACVLVVDRVITLLFDGWSKTNLFSQQSILATLASLFSLLIFTLFDISLIFFLIFYIINKGLGTTD
jgi:hypothetical protein